ncbi:superfamily II DNA/RNA helicase [Oscillochloris trichoides DG-6]|uniref:Superfamily II DNA/RNA helicase n=1 Tax=Oscillochloris trichoides DG-6 TaxID=765420 RepID=E1IHD0_9CHLR|nr:restriction endonuclease [Oscillochloris trichoides]EFO79383.1 superfamily II DNA/RNA helicase [Oscillochloris trichoides DG-6]
MPHPPHNPDLQHQLREHIFALSPYAFELLAGDLLPYIGLQHVTVTRQRGDGGIDAEGDLITPSGLVRVRTGVQVKRHRNNIGRPDIDRFIGALGGKFRHGLFITTSNYAPQALQKAKESPLIGVDTINGGQLIALMQQHNLGVCEHAEAPRVDADFFLQFEAQARLHAGQLKDAPATYLASQNEATLRPQDDLISMHTLGFELRVDPYTVQDWVRNGRLTPDSAPLVGQRERYFFRRDRIATIRHELGLDALPSSGAEWRQAFLDFARSRQMTRSYKPVLLLVLLRHVDRRGEAHIDRIAQEFRAFYQQQARDGHLIESDGPLHQPDQADLEAVRRLIIKHPLERFILQHFLEYDPATGMVRFTPELWQELRAYELRDLQASAEAQLHAYRQRRGYPPSP